MCGDAAVCFGGSTVKPNRVVFPPELFHDNEGSNCDIDVSYDIYRKTKSSPIHLRFKLSRSATLTSVAPLIANRVVFLVPYSMGSIRRMWELNWLDVLTDCIERPIQWIRFETDAVLDNVVELPSLIHHDWNHRLVCSGPL